MKDVRGTGKSPKRDVHISSRKLICLAVSAVALAIVLSSVFIDSDSSADTGNSGTETLVLYDVNGNELTTPLIDNSTISFSTTTTPEGVVYELNTGTPIESCPAYFVIRADSGTGHSLFKVSVKVTPETEGGFTGTWMEYFGIRVCAGNGNVADLREGNPEPYEMKFTKDNVDSAFELNRRYDISFQTLGGSQLLDAPPGSVHNFTIELTPEPIPEIRYIKYYSDNELIVTIPHRDIDPLGEFPEVHSQGRDPIGWIDYNGKIVTEETPVSELPTDMVFALYGWPIIIEMEDKYTDPDGSEITDKLRKEIYEDGTYFEDLSKKTEYKDGNVKEETTHRELDPFDNTYEYDTRTDIIVHDDGAETHRTSTETRENGEATETSTIRTEYNSDKEMIEEEKDITVRDPERGSETDYDVVIRVIDNLLKEKRYKVMATVPEMDLEDVEKAKEYIDDYFAQYDCEIAAVGMKTNGNLTIPHELMGSFVANNYRVFNENGNLRVELDEDVVKWLYENSTGCDLIINKATEKDMTEAQREVIGDNYAINVVLKVDGEVVSVLPNGSAEISIGIDGSSKSVYYVDDSGSSEYIECVYDEDTQTVRYKVDHFSIFMLVEEEKSHAPIWPYIAIVLAELLLVPLIAAIVYRRRKKKEEQV